MGYTRYLKENSRTGTHPFEMNPVVDCEQERSFKLPPARRIFFGAALCFLAALLAVDAKVAWVADAGSRPNDLTAVKLSPIAAKTIELKAQSAPPEPHHTAALLLAAIPAQPASIPFSASLQLLRSPSSQLAILDFRSPALFIRPPPSI